jgi:catechol 2,3-dioxygenase-like lactoylglutathione lyase family enzyme
MGRAGRDRATPGRLTRKWDAMTVPLKNVGAITLFVEDLEASRSFYRDVLGLTVVFEDDNSAVVDLGNTLVNLLDVSQAPELIGPGVVAGPQAGSRFQLTIWVDDVDAVCADLTRRGVDLLNGPVDRAWGQRTACFADPAGHIWEVAQSIADDS